MNVAYKELTNGELQRIKDEDDDSEDEDNALEMGAEDEISKLKFNYFNGYRRRRGK